MDIVDIIDIVDNVDIIDIVDIVDIADIVDIVDIVNIAHTMYLFILLCQSETKILLDSELMCNLKNLNRLINLQYGSKRC